MGAAIRKLCCGLEGGGPFMEGRVGYRMGERRPGLA